MDEQERQRRLRALQGSDELDREAYGLAPEQEITASPEIQRSLMAYAMPDGTPRPSPSPSPSPSPEEAGLVQSIYDLLSGKQAAPAAPIGNSGLYNFKPSAADALSEKFGGKKRKK